MRPTRLGTLAAVFSVVAALCWGVLSVLDSRGATLPPQPWTVPALLAALTATVAVSTVALRRRFAGRGGARPVDPLGAARMAVLGKAAAHAGAGLAGAYAGYLVLLLGDLIVEVRRERAIVAGVSIVVALLLVAAGLWLERSCRIPPDDDADRPGGAPPAPSA